MDVTIRSRRDGILELAPKQVPLELADRLLLTGTILLVSVGLFVCGTMPIEILAAIAATCIAGELVFGVKALALFLLHPAAEVLELAQVRIHRR